MHPFGTPIRRLCRRATVEITVVESFGVSRHHLDGRAAGDADIVTAAFQRGGVGVMPIVCGLLQSRLIPADEFLPRGDVRLHGVHPIDSRFVTAPAAKAVEDVVVEHGEGLFEFKRFGGAALAELLQSGENSFRDGTIGGDGHVEGHRAALGIDNANSLRECRRIKTRFYTRAADRPAAAGRVTTKGKNTKAGAFKLRW
jgi:hypothetical protein